MEKYAIFIDIDGTLFDGKEIPPENIRAVNEAVAAGHFVFINTGRGYSFVPDSIRTCADFTGVVAGVGAHVVIGGETRKSVTFEKEKIKQLFGIFKNTETVGRYQGEKNYYYQNKPDCAKDETLLTDESDIDRLYDEMLISKATFFSPKPTDEQTKILKDLFFAVEYPYCVELTSKGQNKAVGMLDAAKLVGVKPQNCIAIGDSENDLDMLRAAGISVAMGNAQDNVKAICDFVTFPCENGGVAHAIDKLVLKKNWVV